MPSSLKKDSQKWREEGQRLKALRKATIPNFGEFAARVEAIMNSPGLGASPRRISHGVLRNYESGKTKIPPEFRSVFSQIASEYRYRGYASDGIDESNSIGMFKRHLTPPEGEAVLSEVRGRYISFYNIGGHHPRTGEPVIGVRKYNIDAYDNRDCTLTGSFETFDRDRTMKNVIRGAIKMHIGESNRALFSLLEIDRGRDRPPVYFILRYIKLDSVRFFYGMGLGYRSKADHIVIAAKVLLLEAISDNQFEEAHEYWNAEAVGQAKWECLMTFFRGKIDEDSECRLHASPEFVSKLATQDGIVLIADLVREIAKLDRERYGGATPDK